MPNPGPVGRARTLLGHGIVGLYPKFALPGDQEAKAFSQLLKAWNDADHLDNQTFHHLFVGDKLASLATTRLLREAAQGAKNAETIDQMIAASRPLIQAIKAIKAIKAIGPGRWPDTLQSLQGRAEAVAEGRNDHSTDIIQAGWFDSVFGNENKEKEFLDSIASEVNPTNSGDNCEKIMDAVIERLRGTNPDAVAEAGRGVGWPEIKKHYKIAFVLGSFDEIFTKVREAGDGAIAVIGIIYPNGVSHVLVIANVGGVVGIIDGQDKKEK